MTTIEGELDIVFHGVAYNLQITVNHDVSSNASILSIDLEELGAASAWHGEFSASFIENMTGKTGSFKSFDVFVQMLHSALWQQAETVFIDLLTFSDLVRFSLYSNLLLQQPTDSHLPPSFSLSPSFLQEAIKAKRRGDLPNLNTMTMAPVTSASATNKKRYLILTYVVEFDR